MGQDKPDHKSAARAVPRCRTKQMTLPPANPKRWVAHRKAEVVAAVRRGLLSLDAACERYGLSAEEYLSWESAIAQYGLDGLRITVIQHHRSRADCDPRGFH